MANLFTPIPANLNVSTVNAASLAVGTSFVANAIQVTLSGIPLNANGSTGTSRQVLTSNGASGAPYWSSVSGGSGSVNTDAQYTFTNTISFSNTISFTQTINGTANNATNFGGLSLTTVQSQITGNAVTAFANAIANAASNAAGIYQTTAGLLANVATLTSNNSTNFGGLSLATIQSQITGNAATAYSNAVANASALYQTTAGLSANVATLTSANATLFAGQTLATVQGQITGNASTAFANAIANAYSNAQATYYLKTGGTISGDVVITGNLNITGTTVYANVTNLDVKDLNITVAKGAASNAASDGAGLTVDIPGATLTYSGSANTWNVNRGFAPTSTLTFDLGGSTLFWQGVYANTINLTGGATLNATFYSGTAANATTLSSVSLATIQSQITGNAATAYSNAVANASALYQTTAGLSANVATLTSNNSTNFGGLSLTTVQSQITGNAATAFANAIANAASNAAGIYQTTSGLSANVATLTSNNSTNFGGLSLTTVQSQITGNAATAFANAIANAASNAAGIYQTTAGLSANVATLTSNNSTNFNSQPASYYTNATNITTGTLPWAQAPANTVNTSGNFTISGVYTLSSNMTFNSTGALFLNTGSKIYDSLGLQGTVGQVLTSNGTGNVYWSTVSGGGVNTANQYVWSNTQTFSANVVINGVLQSGVVTINAASNATITPVASNTNHNNIYNINATPTINQPSGAAYADAQKLMLRLKDSGTANSLTWNVSAGSNSSTTAGFRPMATSNVALPSTTIAGKVTYVACVYNALDFYWDVVGVSNQ